MSREGGLADRKGKGFPRVSGDEPTLFQEASIGIEFSPRERG